MKCFYHSADLDGHCSGELIRRAHPGCGMIGINYGEAFPWESIQAGETVYMVDFCLQPFEDMLKLNSISNLTWIDHHQSAINEWSKMGEPNILGLRDTTLAGCELTFKYLWLNDKKNGRKKVPPPPRTVTLLGRYDVWDHSDEQVLPFQYGFRTNENTIPGSDCWRILDFGDRPTDELEMIYDYLDGGEAILKYISSNDASYIKAYAFETIFEDKKCLAVNKGMASSQIFDSVKDPYDMFITFVWAPKISKWLVSLYSTTVDVSVIARKHGGGGHKGASGFQCDVLPLYGMFYHQVPYVYS